jgi:hypothetical protein
VGCGTLSVQPLIYPLVCRNSLVNAVTHCSQEVADYDRATDFEALGGQLIELPASSCHSRPARTAAGPDVATARVRSSRLCNLTIFGRKAKFRSHTKKA